jgi:hypothetical protein
VNLDRLLGGPGWRRQLRTTKFIAYFHLVEACGKPGCPVCRCLRESTFRSLDALLYEQVTDPATRGVLDQSWGFCAWHAGMSKEVQNAGLGIAIIYQDLLGQVREHLTASRRELAGSPVVRGWRRLFRRHEPVALVRARAIRKRCPLCHLVGSAEVSYLHTLLEYGEDPEFDRAYGRSAGLCLPHLILALASHPGHRGVAPLLVRTVGKLDQLAKELRGFIDKHDYRKHAPFSDEEAASWTDALGFLVGDPGLFGNEILRSGRPLGSAPALPSRPEEKPTELPSGPLEERFQALAFEKERFEQRLRELMKQLGDESSRAAALHYRLWVTTEDRKVLEMNLAGEQAASRTWETVVQDLRAEIAELKRRLAKYEPPPEHAA